MWPLTDFGNPTVTANRSDVHRSQSTARRLDKAVLVVFLLMLDGLRTGVDVESGIFLTLWGVTYAITVVGLIIERRRAGQLFVGALPVLAVVAICVCSVAWSDFGDIAFKRVMELVATTASAYLVVCRLKLGEFLECVALAGGLAASMSLAEVLAFPSNGIMQEEYAGAWRGIFIHKNELGQGMVLALVTMLVLAFRRETSRRARFAIGVGAIFCGVMLVGSQSATSYIMLVVLAAIVLSFVVARSPFGPIAAIGVAAVAVLIGLNIETLIDALGRDSTLSGRTDLWQLVIEAITKRPLLGYGYGTFWLPEGRASAYLPVLLDWSPYHAHNGLLELSLDVGLVGVAVFLIGLVVALWRAGRVAFVERNISWVWPLVAVIYFISGNLTEASIANYNDVNWVIFVIAALYASRAALQRRRATTRSCAVPIVVATGASIPRYVAPPAVSRRTS